MISQPISSLITNWCLSCITIHVRTLFVRQFYYFHFSPAGGYLILWSELSLFWVAPQFLPAVNFFICTRLSTWCLECTVRSKHVQLLKHDTWHVQLLKDDWYVLNLQLMICNDIDKSIFSEGAKKDPLTRHRSRSARRHTSGSGQLPVLHSLDLDI